MRNRITLFLAILLAALPLVPAVSEGIVYTMDAVTYTVQWVYYDGRVAEIGLLQTPNLADVALVDALSFDPNAMDQEPMSVAAKAGKTVVGSYCEVAFDPNVSTPGVRHGGGGTFAGAILQGYEWLSLPLGVSPESVEATVTTGVRTSPEQGEYDEWGGFAVAIPRADKPLIGEETDLDLGATRVKHVAVSRTPSRLVVNVFHTPVSERAYPSFTAYAMDGTALHESGNEANDAAKSGLVHAEAAYDIAEGEPLPDAIRLHYNGAPAKELLVDLAAGTVTILDD